MKYRWCIKEYNKISEDLLGAAFNSEIIAKLLLNRDIDTPDKVRSYLDPNFYSCSLPEEIPDLVKAKDRIIEAINKKEKITIFGDYDVDGVTATSCLLIALRYFTDKVDFYIPSRLTEGYGLNCDAVKKIKEKNKAKILITCDCGITNKKEIELANELGMDVIVTDHHSLPEVLPPAYAILNPKQLPEDHKLHYLPGVGVAYKLAEELLKSTSITASDLLDLVTLGMIADIVPLVHENRYLVQIGLPKLANTNKVGLRELLRVGGISKFETQGRINPAPTTDHIGFGIAPRINAVGRLTDANLAVKLLTTDDLLEAVQIAAELDRQNKERQFICEGILSDAIEMVSREVDLKKDKCIVLVSETWHHGVIGIVASRLVDKFSLPVILIAIDKEQNIARGSGRSIKQLNIIETVTQCSHFLEKFGGHKAACGLSLKPENITSFIACFKDKTNQMLAGKDSGPVLNIDLELPASSLNHDLLSKINKLSPFGLGNPIPLFVSEELEITGLKSIGKNNQHLKLFVKSVNSKTYEALIWNHDVSHQFDIGDKAQFAYTPKINNYNGETFIQLEAKDTLRVGGRQEQVVQLYDFRGRAHECLGVLSREQSAVYFAEALQKDFLPLKTCSRNKIINSDTLVFLEVPPDENTFFDIIKNSQAKKVYLAFSDIPDIDPIKRTVGLLKYAVSNKKSAISEVDLLIALGINKTALAFCLEVLSKIGFLEYKRVNNALNINIKEPTRQNFNELIEYNLLISELKQINQFRQSLFEIKIEGVTELFNKNGIRAQAVSKELVKI